MLGSPLGVWMFLAAVERTVNIVWVYDDITSLSTGLRRVAGHGSPSEVLFREAW